MNVRGEHLVALLNESGIPEQVKNEIRFLMACMHKDAPENCVQWITGQVEGQKIRDLRAVGFALGDVSQQWQKDLLSQLVANPSNDALSILAYAIWREQQFVEKFSLANLQSILNALNIMLNIKQYPPPCIIHPRNQDSPSAASKNHQVIGQENRASDRNCHTVQHQALLPCENQHPETLRRPHPRSALRAAPVPHW